MSTSAFARIHRLESGDFHDPHIFSDQLRGLVSMNEYREAAMLDFDPLVATSALGRLVAAQTVSTQGAADPASGSGLAR